MSQDGKVALITGGLGGVGIAFGEKLLMHGSKVALVDLRDGKEADDLHRKFGEAKLLTLKCDITDIDQLRATYQKVFDTFGGLDIVINAAGSLDEINFERMIAVNMTAVIASSYMAVERMRKDRGGRGGIIINIASVAALKPLPYVVAYGAAKAAVVSFSKTLVANMDDNTVGVRVGTMCPVGVDTEMVQLNPDPKLREMDLTQPHVKDNLKRYMDRVKSNRPLMTPHRMAETLLKYIEEPDLNGSVILVEKEYVEYVHPDEAKGKRINVESK